MLRDEVAGERLQFFKISEGFEMKQEDTKYLGYNSLIEIIHEQMKANNQEESTKHDPCKFYPSSVGKCLRSIVYQMQGYESKQMDGRFLLICENGTYFHERTEKLFATTGLLIAPEVSFRVPELRLSGRSDALIKNFLSHKPSDNIVKLYEPAKEDGESTLLYEGPDNGVIIVELKSISDSGFNYLNRTGAKEAHIMQLTLYMHIMGIKQGMLLYENKNTQEMKEFIIGYDADLAQKIIEKIKSANKHVDEKTLPPKEFERTDFECRYCDYADLCWPVKNKYTIDDVI
jgi:CRISPR/Cas system-associated exonuclease Cas4 (RecB family)